MKVLPSSCSFPSVFKAKILCSPAQDGFIVETTSGTVFRDVDLSEDWVEYDEKLGESVGIYELEHKFSKHKE